MISADELLHAVRLHQVMPQAIEDEGLDAIAPDGETVAAGAPVAGGRAAVVVVAHLREAAAAHAALEEAGQKVAGAPCALGADAGAFLDDLEPGLLLALLDALPESLADDPQMRHRSMTQRSFGFMRAWRLPVAGP